MCLQPTLVKHILLIDKSKAKRIEFYWHILIGKLCLITWTLFIAIFYLYFRSDSSIVLCGKCLAIDNFLFGEIFKEGHYVENVHVKVRQEAKRVKEIMWVNSCIMYTACNKNKFNILPNQQPWCAMPYVTVQT